MENWISARCRFRREHTRPRRGGAGNILPYLRDRWKWLRYLSRTRLWSVAYRVHRRLGRSLPPWLQDQSDILIECFYRYKPEPYPGRVLLFRHGSRPEGMPGDPLLGWGGFLTGRFEVCDVAGNHTQIFEEPNVRVMAEKLSESLIEVQKGCRTDRATA